MTRFRMIVEDPSYEIEDDFEWEDIREDLNMDPEPITEEDYNPYTTVNS